MATASLRRYSLLARRALRASRLLQIALIVAFWVVGEVARLALGLPVPGGIVGIFIVLALFAGTGFGPSELRRGAGCFLAEMLLFFVPAVPAVLGHPEMIGWLGLKILAVIVTGTIAVMVVTAFVVDLCSRRLARAGEAADAEDGGEACTEGVN